MTSECFSRNDVFATLVICVAEPSTAQSRFPVFCGGNFFVVLKVCLAYPVLEIFIAVKG